MLKERRLRSALTMLVFVTATTVLSGCGDRGPSPAEQAAAAAREAEKAADEKAREERKARVEAERLAVLWRYQEATVGGGRQVTASILSIDNVDTDGTGAKPV
jgi:predicted small lipoprotein YifL